MKRFSSIDGQLRLIEGGCIASAAPFSGKSPDWALDDEDRLAGRLGIAQARAVLRQATPPRVLDRDRRAS